MIPRREPTKVHALFAVAVWKIALFSVAWAASFFLPFAPRFPYADILLIPSKLPFWVWSFANFDGVHYLTIAKTGYSAQYTQVFFPLYPILIRNVGYILPFLSPVIIGQLISVLCLITMIFMLYSLIKIDYKTSVSMYSIIFLLFFPTSFFWGSIYTESLFMMLTVGSFLAARKGNWVASGIFGGLASGTRSVGVFLLPALLWEWWEQNKGLGNRQKAKIFYSPLLLIIVGIGIYMAYLQVKFGDALYFWHAQPVFGAQRSGNSIILLPQVLWRYMKILRSVPMYTETFWIPFAEMFFTLFCISSLLYAHKIKVRLSYLIFSWIAVILPTLTGTFSSMPRYVLVAFPMYIVLASIKRNSIKISLLLVFISLLVVFTGLFTRGHWVS
jgi:Gpi18-like mannosyltransferase